LVDFLGEGLNAEITRFQSGPAINQAIAAGNVAVGDVGLRGGRGRSRVVFGDRTLSRFLLHTDASA